MRDTQQYGLLRIETMTAPPIILPLPIQAHHCMHRSIAVIFVCVMLILQRWKVSFHPFCCHSLKKACIKCYLVDLGNPITPIENSPSTVLQILSNFVNSLYNIFIAVYGFSDHVANHLANHLSTDKNFEMHEVDFVLLSSQTRISSGWNVTTTTTRTADDDDSPQQSTKEARTDQLNSPSSDDGGCKATVPRIKAPTIGNVAPTSPP